MSYVNTVYKMFEYKTMNGNLLPSKYLWKAWIFAFVIFKIASLTEAYSSLKAKYDQFGHMDTNY